MSYHLLSTRKKQPLTPDLLFSDLYSKFSMEIVAKLFAQYCLQGLDVFLDHHRREVQKQAEISRKIAIRAQKDLAYSYLVSEFIVWSLLHREKANVYVPSRISEEDILVTLVQQSLTKIVFTYGITPAAGSIRKEAKKIVASLQLPLLLKKLHKNYLPPLADKHPKDYEVIGKKGEYHRGIQEPTYHLQLVKKDEFEQSFPTSTIMYVMPSVGNSIFLQMEQVIPYSTLKRVSSSLPEKQMVLFQLLQLYSHGEIFQSNFTSEIKIVEPKLQALYEKSTECLATPFQGGKRPYFSLYPEVEQYLGSKGSYLDLEPQSGIFSLRPLRSYVFVNDAIQRARRWLKEAEKAGRKLTVLFWFPNMIPPTDVVFHEEEKNVTKEISVLHYVEEDFLPLLETSPYLKDVFVYSPGEKLPKNTSKYLYKVFVLSSA